MSSPNPCPQCAARAHHHDHAPAPLLNFHDPRFVKGLAMGAAATWLLSQQPVQHALFRGVARLWSSLHGGVEEMKERFHDAQAEVQHQEETP